MSSHQQQRLRIIGGQWRRRQINFPAIKGLRPTPDRVRETVFNWLAPIICGTTCLDLFAGSGVLGIEALSRGAEQVMFVDKSAIVMHQLKENCRKLGTAQATFFHDDAFRFLKTFSNNTLRPVFDIIFIDPPFHHDLARQACQQLATLSLLKPSAYIYLETEKQFSIENLPSTWQILKAKQSRQLNYFLIHHYHEAEI